MRRSGTVCVIEFKEPRKNLINRASEDEDDLMQYLVVYPLRHIYHEPKSNLLLIKEWADDKLSLLGEVPPLAACSSWTNKHSPHTLNQSNCNRTRGQGE